jgi:hypothetical protein
MQFARFIETCPKCNKLPACGGKLASIHVQAGITTRALHYILPVNFSSLKILAPGTVFSVR